MNAIKSIGKKFARYIVGQNQESFEDQLKEFINVDWFKERAFGEHADEIHEVILKGYEPIDTFFDDFDAAFFMYQLVVRMDIEVVSNIQSGCSVNEDESVQKQWLKFAYSGKMDPDMGLCSSLYRMTLYSQDMYLQEKKIARAIIPYLNEYELDTIAQNFLALHRFRLENKITIQKHEHAPY